jgi:hypothetical protein
MGVPGLVFLVRRFVLPTLLLVSLAGVAAAQPRGDNPCDINTSERVVAVADVHGAYDRFVAILRAAGLVDRDARWSGGRAVFVQTGDVLDRGPDSRRALDLIRRLEREASRAGGRVISLIGNHEVMRMVGDLRYVSDGEYAAFRTSESEGLRDRYFGILADDIAARAKRDGQPFDRPAFRSKFLEQTPLGAIEMQLAFGPKGDYGRWLRERDTMIRINDVVFIHGGVSPSVAALGCEQVNATVRKELATVGAGLDPEGVKALLATQEDGPLWYRGLALNDEAEFGGAVDAILRALGARAMVTGHTVTASGRPLFRFGNRVVLLDTGLVGAPFFPDGRASALELLDGRLTAIYEDGRQVLPALPAIQR